jgi:WD40 repeat protein
MNDDGSTNYTIIKAHDSPVNFLLLFGDGLTFASASQDSTIKIWQISTRKLVNVLVNHTDIVWSMALLDDGRLVSASADNYVIIWK